MKDRLKLLYPHLIAVAIFILVGCIYFAPALKGYGLKQHDTNMAIGMSHEAHVYKAETGKEAYWTNSAFSGMPTTQISADYDGDVIKYVFNFIEYTLPQPIGTWMMFALSFYILMLAMGVNRWLGVVAALAFAFSTYFVIILGAGHVTKAMAISFAPLIIAGFVWSFKGRYWLGAAVMAIGMALECYSNHVQVTYYLMFIILFMGIAQLYDAITNKTLPNFFKASVISIVAVLIGVMVNFGNLYNTYSYGKYTNRGQSELTVKPDGSSNKDIATDGLDRDYVTSYSYGTSESFTFLVPNIKGGNSKAIGFDHKAVMNADPQFQQQLANMNQYWGNELMPPPIYAGACVFLLFVLGMFFLRGSLRWALLAASLLALMLAWGKNFMGLTDFFLDHIPAYNKFRAVTIILYVAELCIPVVGFLFVQDVIQNPDRYTPKKKMILYVSGAVAGVLVLFYLLPESFFDFISITEQENFSKQVAEGSKQNPDFANIMQRFVDSLKTVRIDIFKSDVLRSLFFVSATGAVVYLTVTKALKPMYTIVILGALVLVDLVPVNKRYLNNEMAEGSLKYWDKTEQNDFPFPASSADMEILNLELAANPALTAKMDAKIEKRKQELGKKGKMLSASEETAIRFEVLNQNTDYRVFNQASGAFSDASTSYFHKSIGGYHGAKLKRYLEIIDFHFYGRMSMGVLNMLNTKYVIASSQNPANGQEMLIAQQNPGACGNVWFVKELVQVADANKEIVALRDFDPKKTAFVDKRFSADLKPFTFDSTATISLKNYSPDELVYESNASKDQLAVFSEMYYEDGWKAYVDGKEVPHFRADYVLRGLMVPAGKHKIEFKFYPDSVKIGENVSYAGSILLVLVCAGAIFFGLRSKKEEAA